MMSYFHSSEQMKIMETSPSQPSMRLPFPVGGKTHCALIAAHASDVQKQETRHKGETLKN
jgi:hypothetical protein